MTDYLPITLSSLRSDTIINCDVYLLVNMNSASRYILYCKGDTVFENGKKELLVRKNINRLFISRGDQQKYFEYLGIEFSKYHV